MTKIVHIAGRPVPARAGDGGMPRSVQWLAEAQAAAGDQVHVISPAGHDTTAFTHWTAAPFDAEHVDDCLRQIPGDFVVHFHASDLDRDPQVGRAVEASGHPFVVTVRGNHGPDQMPLANRVYLSADHGHRHGHTTYVYNGLPLEYYPPGPGGGGYALFLGKVQRRNKGAKLAIAVARRGVRTVLAGGRHIKYPATWLPLCQHLDVVGVVDGDRKLDLLRHADALLFPIQWDEPFGLVLIEALAVGTPVVATNRGAVAEIVQPNVTGILADPEPAALQAAVEQARALDRDACRESVAEYFTAERVAEDYRNLYNTAQRGTRW